jgi:serine/threonine protein kinase
LDRLARWALLNENFFFEIKKIFKSLVYMEFLSQKLSFKKFIRKLIKKDKNTEINTKDNIKDNIEKNCPECGKEVNIFGYCEPCNSAYFRDNFAQWTSGDSNLDKLIQYSQLNANWLSKLIEWIEYSNLEDIELVAHGGFGSVYKAIWKDGLIKPCNVNKPERERCGKMEVAVKKFRNVTHVNSEFLNEVSF